MGWGPAGRELAGEGGMGTSRGGRGPAVGTASKEDEAAGPSSWSGDQLVRMGTSIIGWRPDI